MECNWTKLAATDVSKWPAENSISIHCLVAPWAQPILQFKHNSVQLMLKCNLQPAAKLDQSILYGQSKSNHPLQWSPTTRPNNTNTQASSCSSITNHAHSGNIKTPTVIVASLITWICPFSTFTKEEFIILLCNGWKLMTCSLAVTVV